MSSILQLFSMSSEVILYVEIVVEPGRRVLRVISATLAAENLFQNTHYVIRPSTSVHCVAEFIFYVDTGIVYTECA